MASAKPLSSKWRSEHSCSWVAAHPWPTLTCFLQATTTSQCLQHVRLVTSFLTNRQSLQLRMKPYSNWIKISNRNFAAIYASLSVSRYKQLSAMRDSWNENRSLIHLITIKNSDDQKIVLRCLVRNGNILMRKSRHSSSYEILYESGCEEVDSTYWVCWTAWLFPWLSAAPCMCWWPISVSFKPLLAS